MRRPRFRRTGSGEHGATLLELLVVLGIIAIGLALVAPSLGRARLGVTVRATAMDLSANLRAVRAAARSTNVEHALIIDLGRRQYWSEGVVKPRPLPAMIGVEVMVPDLERVTGTEARIRFFPDGSTSGAKVLLKDGRSAASLAVDWLSGDVRLQVR